MVFKRIIKALLEKNEKVIVPINCNVPEHDDEYLEKVAQNEKNKSSISG